MLSHLLRALNRQTFKSIQTNNYVKRFYANQDVSRQQSDADQSGQQTADDNNWSANSCQQQQQKYYHFQDQDVDEYTRLYHEYYQRYYDNKFDTKSNSGSDDNKDDGNHRDGQRNEKCKSNTFSFSECKYHLMTIRLLEKIGYIGAALVVGLHFEGPLHNLHTTGRPRLTQICDRLEGTANDGDKCWKVCGRCHYCNAFLSKLFPSVFSAPIRKNHYFNNGNSRYITNSTQIVVNEELKERTCDESKNNIENEIKSETDPIEDLCKQLQTASIDYVDQLNNLLGISLINTDPDEAIKCWSSSKSNPKALFNLGVAYESGRYSADGTVDLKSAFRHYALSASMGHKNAIYNLSLFYLYGKGDIAVDLDRAETLLRRAAELGVKQAEYYIQELELRRSFQLAKQRNILRSSASAPNLTLLTTCHSEKSSNNYLQAPTYAMARV
ncbi:uncharacterized protein LOC128959584 [Oppia nitens]|uniref:uncharacterized protein LOC128959584 n=1 Tax=Oppia nitens TaxID=1686743 RepID=UPI0023DA2B95|nr:uncharacterized protein LOC128959584 [Oppia nitens]